MNIKKIIDKYVSISTENINTYFIVMVANVQNITKDYTNYSKDSIISEYYSYKQYEEILTTLRDVGFEVVCYFDENSFIIDYLAGKLNTNKKILVLNSSQTGIGSGRKSLIPSFCELNSIPHTNSDSFISTYTRQKYHWYCYLKEGGFPVADSWLYSYDFGWFNGMPQEGQKIIIKLNREASSIGLSKDNIFVYNKSTDSKIKTLSECYSQPVIVQRFISGYEVEVPCLVTNDLSIAFEPTGISVDNNNNLGNQILDYSIRGNHFFDFYEFNTIDKELSQAIQRTTECVSKKMSLFGLARIDFRINNQKEFFITDVSSNPHITKSMTFYYLYQKLGYTYTEVLLTLLGMSIERNL